MSTLRKFIIFLLLIVSIPILGYTASRAPGVGILINGTYFSDLYNQVLNLGSSSSLTVGSMIAGTTYQLSPAGGTDDTTLVQAAFTSYSNIYVPSGTAYVVSNITLAHDTWISGPGKIQMKAGATGAMISAGTAYRLTITGVELYGGSDVDRSATTSSTADRSGIALNSQLKSRIDGCIIHGFENKAIYDTANAYPSSGTPALEITNCRIYYNFYGWFGAATNGQYLLVSNNNVHYNRYGFWINAGNNQLTGNNINCNGYGVYIESAAPVSNGAHGSITGGCINHNIVSPIYIHGAAGLGFTVTGVQIHYGDIFIIDSSGVSIIGCELNVYAFNLSGGGRNYVRDNCVLSNYSNINHSYAGGSADDTWFMGNFYPDGTFLPNIKSTSWTEDGKPCAVELAKSGTATILYTEFVGDTTTYFSGGNGSIQLPPWSLVTAGSRMTIQFLSSGDVEIIPAYAARIRLAGTSLTIANKISSTVAAGGTIEIQREAAGWTILRATDTWIDAGASTPVLPTDIASLIGWYKADTGLYQDSGKTTPATLADDPIGAWADQSGLGNDLLQATSANRPVLKLNELGSASAIQFASASKALAAVYASPTNTALTIIVVGKWTGAGYWFWSADGSYALTLLTNSSGMLSSYSSGFSGTIYSTINSAMPKHSGPVGGTNYFLQWPLSVYQIGRLHHITTTATNFGGPKLGASGAAFSTFNIVEMLIFNANLSDADALALDQYLGNRFGFSL